MDDNQRIIENNRTEALSCGKLVAETKSLRYNARSFEVRLPTLAEEDVASEPHTAAEQSITLQPSRQSRNLLSPVSAHLPDVDDVVEGPNNKLSTLTLSLLQPRLEHYHGV